LEGATTDGVGFTVIVYVVAVPAHPAFPVVVAVAVKTIVCGVAAVFIKVNAGIEIVPFVAVKPVIAGGIVVACQAIVTLGVVDVRLTKLVVNCEQMV